MDINTIKECSDRSLAGNIKFPAMVMKLLAAGVERYTVDLVSFTKTYYGVAGEVHTISFTFDALKVAADFNAKEIKDAITASQKDLIDYQTFLRRVIPAGCSHYEAFLTGKKVIYLGRDGSYHIELFPQ